MPIQTSQSKVGQPKVDDYSIMSMTHTQETEAREVTSAAERRRSPRHPRKTPAWLSAASGARSGNGLNVEVRDLSLHGVGFISDQLFKKNDNHWMVIADRSLRLSTRVRIVAIREREDGKWDVGGEFF